MGSDQESKEFNLKVLVVDDNKPVKLILGEMLKNYTREIIFADDGKEAVNAIENNTDIDLILMDVYMPGMDGFESTRKIRDLNKEVIIFVMTATALSELIEEFAGIVINDYFPKPLSSDYLNQLIEKHFKKKQLTN